LSDPRFFVALFPYTGVPLGEISARQRCLFIYLFIYLFMWRAGWPDDLKKKSPKVQPNPFFCQTECITFAQESSPKI
jgi:hypothetical protein